MGGWRGGKGGGGYDWRQHTRASDDPAVQNACRELCERVIIVLPAVEGFPQLSLPSCVP